MVTSRNSERPSGVVRMGARSAVTCVKKKVPPGMYARRQLVMVVSLAIGLGPVRTADPTSAAHHAREISFAELDAAIRSWIAHVRHADSWGLRAKVLDSLVIRPAEHRRALGGRSCLEPAPTSKKSRVDGAARRWCRSRGTSVFRDRRWGTNTTPENRCG